MPTTIKKCNLCRTELSVSNEAQVVECPACGCINSYGYSRSNQNDKCPKGAPSNKNTGVMPNSQNHQQHIFSAAPTQGQTPLHELLGGTKQPGSLHFVNTNSLFQQAPQASPQYSPPLAKTNSFLQPPPQVVSPSSQVSIRTLKTNYTSFQQLSQKSLSLQSSLPPVKTKTTFQLPSQTSSPPIPERIINSFFQQPQQTSSPQGSPRPLYNNISYQQPFQTSTPPDQDEVNDYSWQPQKTPQGSPRLADSNTSYQPPLQSSPPPIQEKLNSLSELPQQTSSPKGTPNSSYSNSSSQQPIQSSPPEPPHQTQTSSPQGSSPRPSRFSSFLRPHAAKNPPQGSSPLAHNDEYNQKPSEPSSQISSPPSREDNNGHNQISTPPSREAKNGYNQKPLLASTQMSASQVQPLLRASRLLVNDNGQNYQKSIPDTRPVSSSIASTPPVTGLRYGTNQGTSGKFATAKSQSADNQNSRNTEAFRGNLTGAPTNYINKSVADADDDPHYTKRRLKEFREQLQI